MKRKTNQDESISSVVELDFGICDDRSFERCFEIDSENVRVEEDVRHMSVHCNEVELQEM